VFKLIVAGSRDFNDYELLKSKLDNAKKHDKKQIELVANSIERFGWVQPLVVDKDNNLVIGHCRLDSAKLLGQEEVPVLTIENLTEDEIKALRLADNKLNESAWDMDLVIKELKEIPDLVDLTGFDKDLLIEPDDKDDEVPEVPEEPISKLGDLYELGNHRALCGDSTKQEDVERLMDGNKADMVFTDPPYGIDYQDVKHKFDKIENDQIGVDLQELLQETLKWNCPHYICCNWKSYSSFEQVMIANDRNPKACIVWDKEVRIQNLDKYYKQHEFILYYGLFGGQKTLRGDVWRINRETSKKHPTAKPVALVSQAIKDSVLPENIVLDTFLGSGSTLIACEKTNRICYGMELDPKYIDVIVQRYVDYTGNNNIKLNVRKVNQETQKADLKEQKTSQPSSEGL